MRKGNSFHFSRKRGNRENHSNIYIFISSNDDDKIYSVNSLKLQRFCTLRCLSQGYCFSKHSGRFQQWEKLERIEQQQKTHQVYRKRHNAFGKEKNTSSRISLFNWWVWSLENLNEIRASQGLYTFFTIRVSMDAVTKKTCIV